MSKILQKGIEAAGKCVDKDFVRRNLDAWKLLLMNNSAEITATKADIFRDEGNFVDAADLYKSAAKKCAKALKYCKKASETDEASIEIAMERLIPMDCILL